MRYTSLDHINQTEYLAKPIYSSDGRVLLSEGVQLTVGLISKLRRLGIHAIYVEDEKTADVEIEEVVSDQTKRETVKALSESFQFIQSGKKDFQLKSVSKVTKSLIDEILANKDVLLNLTDIRTDDNALYIHSLNVCMISTIIGIRMRLDRGKLRDLAIGALFHDIGKVEAGFSEEKEKPPLVVEQEHHTWRGFNLLRYFHDFSRVSAIVALQHHEHLDGTGVPRNISSEDIHLYSKIVAVANYYDNLITGRNGLNALYPYEACERVFALTNTKFDHDVVWNFLRSIAFYPTGSTVKLTSNQTGVVVNQNRGLPQRPVVRVFEGDVNEDDYEMFEINLAEETTLFIDKMFI